MLTIETKQDHPIAIAYRDQYGSVYFISADEFNAIVAAINGKIQSIVPGANITVDNTDPQNPVVSSTGGGDIEWSQTDW